MIPVRAGVKFSTRSSADLFSLWRRNKMFALQLLTFLIASSGAFLPRNDMLLIGNDGEFTRNTAIQFLRLGSLFPGLSMAPFEGMGTLFSLNPMISPSLLPIALFRNAFGVWLGFMVCAGLVFASTFMLGRALGLDRRVSMLAAWILPPLCLPYQSWLNLYLTFNLNPLAGDCVSFAMLGIALLARGYSTPSPHWEGLGLALVVIWFFIANPLWLMLVLPSVACVSIGIMASHVRERDFLRRSAFILLPSVFFVAFGGTPYLLGLYRDTAVAFFPQEMNQAIVHSWRMCSIATAWGTIDPIGFLWFGSAVTGLALAIWTGDGMLRRVAQSIIAAILILVGYIVIYFISSSWVLPYPIYFEFFLWPFYALFAAYAAVSLLRYTGTRFTLNQPAWLRNPALSSSPLWLLLGAGLAVLLANNPFSLAEPLYRSPQDTAITRILQTEIGLAPDTKFEGYVATLTGFEGPEGPRTDWFALLPETNEAFLAFANTHRLVYLWRYAIPTVEAYSHAIEPTTYAVISRLLDRPDDGQVRGVTIVTQPDFRLLQSMGVRFMITDYYLPAPARLRTHLVSQRVSHFLYELPEANIGNYSPTQIVQARNATDLLTQIADRRLDFRKVAVLDGPLDRTLQPTERSSSNIVRGGWRIQASSRGTSMLLLPLHFSNCLFVTDTHGHGGEVIEVRRANLINTAIVFEGTIDVTLELRVSPFWHPYCRLRDEHEMKEFGLSKIPRNIMSEDAHRSERIEGRFR